MIEALLDMPTGVTGFRVSGRLSGEDLRKFAPTMAERLRADQEIRIVEVIDDDYEGFGPGGLVEDLKLDFGTVLSHHSAFKRIAIVTDKEWVAHTLHALAWMVPGDLAVFRSVKSSALSSGPPAPARMVRIKRSECSPTRSTRARTNPPRPSSRPLLQHRFTADHR